jgi:hypothetical protein
VAAVPFASGAGSSQPGSSAGGAATAPRATRLGRPSWLDPRLVAGIVLILIAVLGGARVVSGAARTTEVWSVRHDLGAGAQITSADLVPVAVRLTTAVGRYLPAGSVLPAGAHVNRSVGAGELLPRSAIATTAEPTVALPLAVATGALPPGLATGTVVDVWAVPDSTPGTAGSAGAAGSAASAADSRAVEVLSGVTVSAVTGGGSLGSSATSVVTVSIPRDATTVSTVLGLTAGHSIVVLPVSGGADPAPTSSMSPAARPAGGG